MSYTFDGFVLDDERYRLTDPDGTEVALEPRAFDALKMLVQDAPAVVTKDKFYERLWPGEKEKNVSGLVGRLDQLILHIRSRLRQRDLVRNVRGKGFALFADVRRLDLTDPVEALVSAPSSTLALSTKLVNPQWADYVMYDAPSAPWILRCQIATPSPYFRFGFKLLAKSARLFGNASIQSDDENLVVHVGRNYWERPSISKRDLFVVGYIGGRRLSTDTKVKHVLRTAKASLQLTLDRDLTVRLFVDDKLSFSQVLPAPYCDRVAVLAWGDQDEYRVNVTDLSLKSVARR
jgi:DNA-binding winged helix-turn-helix (wHTH) protein